MTQRFALDPSDVARGGFAMSSGRKKARYSRANQVSSREMVLIHRPTGLQVKGVIKAGHHSRKVMKQLEDELYRKLFESLEEAVAKALKIPGR